MAKQKKPVKPVKKHTVKMAPAKKAFAKDLETAVPREEALKKLVTAVTPDGQPLPIAVEVDSTLVPDDAHVVTVRPGFSATLTGVTFEPHADSPTIVDAGVHPPPDAPAATIVTKATGEVVLKIDAEIPAIRPPCRICGGEMKSNVCPADGYHLVDAP